MTDSATPDGAQSTPAPAKPAPAKPATAESPNQPPAEATQKPSPKAKAPALEDKPFASYITQDLLPALAKECEAYGGPAPELGFEEGPMPVVEVPSWMVKGVLPGGRKFWLCFTAPQLEAAKMIALAEAGAEPSLLESFLIDEKKMTLPLLVSRLVQRLNGQKWLGPN
ncbi:MAG: DUF2996 domain-containing protein [Cyanobium sp.]